MATESSSTVMLSLASKDGESVAIDCSGVSGANAASVCPEVL